DYVSNAAALAGGINPESDGAFRARFVNWLETLLAGTPAAIVAAVEGLQQGAVCNYVPNQTLGGVPQLAYFYCVVDDGSGAPPSSFVTAATNAINALCGAGINFAVYSPTI